MVHDTSSSNFLDFIFLYHTGTQFDGWFYMYLEILASTALRMTAEYKIKSCVICLPFK